MMFRGLRSSASPAYALSALGATLLTAALVSCVKEPGNAAGQAAARVGGKEITVSQVNEEVARQPLPPGTDARKVSRQVLETLINQQLVANQAVEQKLDRDPQVMQAIERAKRVVLVQAYLDRKVPIAAAPTEAEIGAYYNSHPELFAHRKAYRLRQISLPAAALTDDLRTRMSQAKSMEEVIALLNAQSVRFRDDQSVRYAEDLPMALVTKLNAMQKGQVFMAMAQGQADLIQVLDSAEQPVSQQQAEAVIKRYLTSQKRGEAVQAEVKRLRGQAKIEYLGEYAQAGKASEGAAAPGGDLVNPAPPELPK